MSNTANHASISAIREQKNTTDGTITNQLRLMLVQFGLFILLSCSFLLLSTPAHAESQAIASGATNKAPAGTPVAVVQNAVEALYYGDIAQAASYYHITDIPNFEAELEAIQPVFAKTVDSISMTEVYYDNTGNKAVVVGKIQLINPTTKQQESDTMLYKLIKIKGDWKIIN